MKKILTIIVALVGISTVWSQCLPTYNSQCTSGDFINDVAFNTISNLGTGCSGPSANNYQDYTAISTNVLQNTSYTITVTPGASWGQYFVAFIDFNNDLDFDDAGEFFDIGYATSSTTISNTIMIPNGIAGGAVTMRVLCKYSSTPVLAGQACNNFSYGECEDYTLNIALPLAEDAGISAFVTPSLPTCNFTDSVRVSLFNYGADTLTSSMIDWTVNAIPQAGFSWTGSIPPYSSEVVNLGLVPLALGDALVAFTSMPNGVVENPSGAWNDSSSITSLEVGLSGVYTIGGTTPNFVDFTSAVTDLNTFGVCGPVTFNVRDGVYTEQINLSAIVGMSVTNTVTFQSENGDASLVALSFPVADAAQNYIVNLDGADFFSFQDLTLENTGVSYGRVIHVQNGADDNTFINCHIHAVTSNSTSTNFAAIYSGGSNDNNNVFVRNIIEGGSYGAYWYGESTTSLESGTKFEGNTFLDNYYYGGRFESQDAPVLNGNSLEGESSYTGSRFAMYINYCDNGFTAIGNTIKGSLTSGWRYGMYILNCDASPINHAIVANNMVQVGQAGSTSTFYGIYLSNDGYIDITHNSVLVSDGGASSRAFYGTSGGASSLANNIFVNYTAGYAIYLASNYTIVSSNYNLFYSPFGITGYYGGTNQATLLDWQAANADDANSISMDPIFHSLYDLHVCNDTLKGLGTATTILTDIDNQARNTLSPDMGADEFSALTTDFLGSDVEICVGDVVTLSAGSPSDTILWSTGDTTLTIDATMAGVYTVSLNSVCGIGADTIDIAMSNIVYTNFLTATDTVFCTGDSSLLSSSMIADSYNWSTAAISPTIQVLSSGMYTLDVSDNCGSGSDSVNITVLSTPVASYTFASSYVSASFTNTSTGSNSTYLWDFGDGSTSSVENPSHVFSNTGPHTITLTVTNICGTDTYSSIVSMVGLDELSNIGSVAVFPNPSFGVVTLSLNLLTQSDINLSVQNVLGKEIYKNNLKQSTGQVSHKINLSNVGSGVYFIHVNVGGEKLIRKVIIN